MNVAMVKNTTPTIKIQRQILESYQKVIVSFKGTNGTIVAKENPREQEGVFYVDLSQEDTRLLGSGDILFEVQYIYDNNSKSNIEICGKIPMLYSFSQGIVVGGGGIDVDVIYSAKAIQSTVEVGEGSGGTFDHSKLFNRDALDQHTIESISGLVAELLLKQHVLTPGKDMSIDDNIISYTGTSSTPVTTHNALDGRSDTDAHPISSISMLSEELIKLNTGYNSIDDKLDANVSEIHEDIVQAYTNSVSYPIIDMSYNSTNTWITFNDKIYRCIKDTIWTGTITSDWQVEYMTVAEVHAYVAQKIQEFEEQEFPLQMRPDGNFGVYQTKAEFPLIENKPGYLCMATNDGESSGIYIWGIDYTNPTQFMWQPFVVIQPITQDTLKVSFNGEEVSLRVAIESIHEYVDDEIGNEVLARNAQFNGLDTRTSALETKALTVDSEINATVFRGTKEQYDTDPNQDNYFLAIII